MVKNKKWFAKQINSKLGNLRIFIWTTRIKKLRLRKFIFKFIDEFFN